MKVFDQQAVARERSVTESNVVPIRGGRASTKITARRLAKVEKVQGLMLECQSLLEEIADEETNGWEPGTPQATKVTKRVKPLRTMAEAMENSALVLEEMYS